MNPDPASPAPVLVAYGSKHGATAQIAERIARVLREHGVVVDLRPAGATGPPARYRAIVLGSAVYMHRWRRDATRLLRRLEREADGTAVWLFSSGPLGDMPADPHEIVPRRVRAAAERLPALDNAVFGGRVPLQPSGFVERAIVKHTPEDRRDSRDWDAIEAWATEIAETLQPAAAVLAS